MEPSADGRSEMPFRGGRFEPDEPADGPPLDERRSFVSWFAAIIGWLVVGATTTILFGIVGLFVYIAVASSSNNTVRTDDAEGLELLRESVELDGCRYVDRAAQQVTVRFTNRFGRRLDQVVIGIEFAEGDANVADQQVGLVDVEPDEVREIMVRDDKPALTESAALDCRVDWVRAFESS